MNLVKYIKTVFLDRFKKRIFKINEERRYSSRPNMLVLEPSNICNANCIFCAYQFDKRTKKIPDFDEFRKTIEEYIEMGGDAISLTPFAGEIFTNKEILGWIRKLSSFKKIKRISTYTNASLFHTVDLKELLTSGLTELHISVPPLEESLYRKIYRSNLYSKVLINLKNILVAFASLDDKTVQTLEISFRSDRSIEECKRLDDYLNFVQPYLSRGVTITAMSNFDSWSGMIKDQDLLPGMQLLHTELTGAMPPCSRIFNTQVLVDGSIRLCGCRFDNGNDEDELVIGNIDETSLKDAYNSVKAQSIRKSFRTGQLLRICQKCSWYDQ